MKKMQQQIQEQMKNMMQGKKGEKGNKGKSSKGLAQLAAQQEMIRQRMGEIRDELSGDQNAKDNIDKMMKKMEELKNSELLFKEKIYFCQLFMVASWKKNVVIY